MVKYEKCHLLQERYGDAVCKAMAWKQCPKSRAKMYVTAACWKVPAKQDI